MGKILSRIKLLARCSPGKFIKYNYLCKNVVRDKGCFLVPFRKTIFAIDPTSRIRLQGSLLLNAGKLRGSRAESYLALDADSTLQVKGQSRINYGSTIHVCPGAQLVIGSFTSNAGLNFQVKEKVTIGEDCMLGRNVTIFDSAFHPTGGSADALHINIKEVVIGDHVWIGANSFINEGACIGDGSIVGPASYVYGRIDNGTTVARRPEEPMLVGNMWARSESKEDITAALAFYDRVGNYIEATIAADEAYVERLTELIQPLFIGVDLTSRHDLFSSHILDSLSLTAVVAMLEESYGVKIPYYEISPSNFNSIKSIADLMYRLEKNNEAKPRELGSDYCGDSNNASIEAYRHTTLIEYVKEHAQQTPTKVAIFVPGKQYTYQWLYEAVKKYGSYLYGVGLSRGDRVVVKATQSIEFIVTYLAIHYVGAVVTSLEKSSNDDKIIDIAQQINASFVITDGMSRVTDSGLTFVSYDNVLEALGSLGSARACELKPPSGDDSADILFTTGTTGASKGVELSHRAVVAGAENIAFGCRMKKSTVLVVPNPLSHSNAIKNLAACLITGCSFYVLDGITDLNAFFNALDCKYGNVATVLPPAAIRTIFKLAKDKLGEYSDKLDYLMAATAPLPEPDRETLRDMLPNTRLYNHYGCSESSSICIYDFNEYPTLKNCVGKAMPHSEVFFVDNNRKPIESSKDNIGYLAVRGDAAMKGYFGAPELTATVMESGVVYTKDLGFIDNEGFVFILGRDDDVINVGGLKVSPLEVEAAALSYDQTVDCICIGKEDNVAGEMLSLLVVPGESFNIGELQSVLTSSLDKYKVPRDIRLVDAIERTYNGKLNRKAYRKAGGESGHQVFLKG